MGLIGKLLSFARANRNSTHVSDAQIDSGGGSNLTAEHFAPPGDDSFPLKGDYAVGQSVQQTGRVATVGYIDSVNEPKASEGEKRIYARDAVSGAVIVEVWLKNDGSVSGANSNGSFELEAGGDFVVNGVTISAGGVVTIPSSLNLGGKELAGHVHAAGEPPGDTGANK